MNEELIDGLKQFIIATISQQTSDLREDIDEIRKEVKDLRQELSGKIDDLSASVAEALDNSNEETEKRLTKLEAKPA